MRKKLFQFFSFNVLRQDSCLYSELPCWVQTFFSHRFGCLEGEFTWGQGASQSTSQLGPQILGLVALISVIFPQVLFLCLMNDSQDSCNRFTYNTAEINKGKFHFTLSKLIS